ncbi:hypothetical protein [Caulobacter hibisci]|uniref:Uncharacterized protein n=1 Tax=Caulobacter hibisci TaxID=2035993 RepID=A0ABS0SS70_9CAUL|nr:hypothetical protein [Caulobacter hibisci]MBI1682361.1 hypothetical protein [Caulobacter hibisci]
MRASLPAIEARAKAPASPKDVERIIGAKFATYRQPERSDGEWAMFWADYKAVLEDVPASALEAAMDAIIRDPKIEFLPKPAKLREIAMLTENRAVRAFDRARQAIELADRPPEQPKVGLPPIVTAKPPKPSEEDRARVKAWAREFAQQDEARKAAEKAQRRADMPDTSGAPDQTGVTPAMRAHLAQKQDKGRAA